MEQQACYKFFIFYFLWILHGHRWFKMSPKGLSRITALLDRVVFFLFNLQFYLHILQLHGAETSSHSPDVQILVTKSTLCYSNCMLQGPQRVTGAKFLCSLVPFTLSGVNLEVLLFYLFTDCFSYCLCGKYRTEPIANAISIVQAETKIILVHLLSQTPGQMQVINSIELFGAGDPFKEKLFWLERRRTA